MYFGIGPITSALLNYFGFRITGAIGTVFAIVGIFSAAFADSFSTLIVTLGIITGIGFGIISCTSILVVGHYFDKYRAVACSVAINGIGAGTMYMGQIIPLFKEFKWRDTFMIISSFYFLIFVLVLSYKSIKPRSVKVTPRPRVSFASLTSSSESSIITLDYTNEIKYKNYQPSINPYPSETMSKFRIDRHFSYNLLSSCSS